MPLALLLLIAIPAMEAHAQKSMGKVVPPASEPSGDKETQPSTESTPVAPWQSLSGDEKPTTINALRAGASKPSPMIIVKRGNLAHHESSSIVRPLGR
jgi:hypothetical protein